MLHRRRVWAATIVALLFAQTIAFSPNRQDQDPAEVDLAVVATVELLAAPRVAGASPAAEGPTSVPLAVDVTVELLAEPLDVVVVVPAVEGPVANPVYSVRGTAYNSMVSQTNAQPFITATGARTGWGIVAVSRDLLGGDLPYGTLVRLRDLGNYHNGRGAGAYQPLLDETVFVVEDTMHPRKRNQIDLWFADYAAALAWGVRQVEVEVVRYGRDGPTLEPTVAEVEFDAPVTWLASR
jgi:3D (Asp-Asp-Asp) domain-containing protein